MHHLNGFAMSLSRSFLFVPGDRPDRFDKAAASGAHGVILDLEDAVQPQAKAAARAAVAGWHGRGGAYVRINGMDTPWFEDDLALARAHGLARLVIPKAEPGVLHKVRERLGADVELIALIETVAGLFELRDACKAGVSRLAFGNLDFSVDAGVSEGEGELDPVRLRLALESRYANLPAPIDGVFPALSDADGLARQVRRAKSLGCGGKLCIHPAQVAVVNGGFVASPEEADWARRVLAAAEQSGGGVISVDGKMVDRPVLLRARELLGAEGSF